MNIFHQVEFELYSSKDTTEIPYKYKVPNKALRISKLYQSLIYSCSILAKNRKNHIKL